MTVNAKLMGKRCYLRPLELEDLDGNYMNWINDPVAAKYILGAGFPTNATMMKTYYEDNQPPNAVLFAVCDLETDEHFGNARLGHIDWINRVARYGRLIGNRKYQARGYGGEALLLLLKFGFYHLGMNRIWSAAVVENMPSRKSNDQVGMIEEGILREFVWCDGKFHDAMALSMLRSDFDKKHLNNTMLFPSKR